jgi:hypothetical protein
MANKVPLIVDINDNNKIKELPVGDNLDLSGSDISQVANITATGVIRQAGLPVSTFSGDYNDINNLPVIPFRTSDLVNDGDGVPNLTFITAADVPPFSDTLNDVVQRGQTSLAGIIIATPTQDVGISASTQNNNVANFTFNNTNDQTDTPALLALKHSDQAIGKLANLQYDGRDNAGNQVTYGQFEMSVLNNTQLGLTSRYTVRVRDGGGLVSPLQITGSGIAVTGTMDGNVVSSGTSTFNDVDIATADITSSLTMGSLSFNAVTNTIQSGTTRLNIGSNNTNITIGGAGNTGIDIETAKVNVSGVLEVDGDFKASTFPLTANFENGLNILGSNPNFTIRSEDQFANYGSTASIKLQSDRKNPPINNDHSTFNVVGLTAQDDWASYRTVARIRVGTEDDESVLDANQSSFFYKFEKFDNTHVPVNTGDYTSIPFVVGYNSEPSGASGDVYKATIVNFYNAQDDFIVLGGSVDGNGFPNKLFKVDYATEAVSTHADVTVGGELTVNGTGNSSVAGSLTVTGDLTVNGTTTTVNTTELEITDKLITVANGSLNAAAATGAGIEVDAGVDANPSLTYVNATDSWSFDRSLVIAGTNSVTATTFSGALSGNATTATTLETTRAINGVNFNGSAPITITAETPNAFQPGTGISFGVGVTEWTGDAVRTIANTDLGSAQDIIKTITVADTIGSFVMAETGSYSVSGNADTFTFIGSTAIDIDIDATNGAIQILNTGVTDLTTGTGLSTNTSATGAVSITNTDRGSAQDIFKTIAVTGSNSIVADSNSDTVTFTGGAGITLTGDATTDTLTIANSGVTSVVAGNYMSVGISGTDYTVTNTGLNTVTGTANEIEVGTKSGGDQVIGLPNSVQINTLTTTTQLNSSGATRIGNAVTDTLRIDAGVGQGAGPVDAVTPAGYVQVSINGATAYLPYFQ